MKHPAALVESSHIGPRTRVWAFAHILPAAQIGADCNICDHVFVENDVRVGDRVTVKCGVQLWDGVTLEDDVFVGPNATFTNDPFPRSGVHPAAVTRTVVRKGASIGANATIMCGLTIGAGAMVGSGAVVTHDVPAHAIVVGNPAFIQGYVAVTPEPSAAGSPQGVTIHRLPSFEDLRGSLLVGELGSQLPFEPKRFLIVSGVPTRQVRGEQAFRTMHQFVVCLAGECSLVIDDGAARQELHLRARELGVHIPPMVWSVQYKFSADAQLLVLCSAAYDNADYIRDYSEFLRLAAG
jgi:UDP-2-acetamido-3-amino-2,3-dideoxy-glucuronate N-acetyltransferase